MKIKKRTNIFNLLVLILILLQFLNIGNYSFFNYTYSGGRMPGIVTSSLVAFRFGVSLLPYFLFLHVVSVERTKILAFFLKHFDFVLLGFWAFMAVPFSINFMEAVAYHLWFVGVLLSVLMWGYYVRKNKEVSVSSSHYKIQLLGNGLIFFLLLLNIRSIFLGGIFGYKIAFSSKDFWPYGLFICIVSLMYVLLINKRNKFIKGWEKIANRKMFFIISVSLFLCYVFMVLGIRRTPAVISIGFIFGFLYLYFGRTLGQRFVIFSALFVLFSLFIGLLPNLIERYADDIRLLDRLSHVTFEGGQIKEAEYHNSYGERKEIWEMYTVLINEKYLIGHGVGMAMPTHSNRFLNHYLSGYSPHNTYLSFWVETGLIGLFLFIVINVRSFLKLFFTKNTWLKYFNFAVLISLSLINWNEYNSSPGQIMFIPVILFLMYLRVDRHSFLRRGKDN